MLTPTRAISWTLIAFAMSFAIAVATASAATSDAHLLTTQRIWNAAPHNAFTGLTYFNGQFYAAFREASQHTVPAAGQQGGDIRVLRSTTGSTWTSAGLFDFGINNDLRDPKVVVTPDNRLMVLATDEPQVDGASRRSYAWFSSNGTTWSNPASAGDPGRWMWRVEWHGNTAYGVSYAGGATRLETSTTGTTFSPLVSTLTSGDTTEAALTFRADGSAVALVRRDPDNALVGTAAAPYTDWTWHASNYFVGGPDMVELPDGRLVVGGRFTDEATHHTKLAFLDASTGQLTPFLTLTSSGDTGYPGLLGKDDRLYVSYYSSHQGKASIYLSTVSFDSVPEPAALSSVAVGGLLAGRAAGRKRRFA